MSSQSISRGEILNALKALFVYDFVTAKQDPVKFYARLSLWFCCIGSLITLILAVFQEEAITDWFHKIDHMVLFPGLMVSVLVAHLDAKYDIVLANLLAHLAIFISFAGSILASAVHETVMDYYVYLPLVALSYLTLLFLWSEYPKFVLMTCLLHSTGLTACAILLDPNWSKHLATFFVFYFSIFVLLFFNIALRQMMVAICTAQEKSPNTAPPKDED